MVADNALALGLGIAASTLKAPAPVLMGCALRTKTHYLDMSAELDSYALVQSLDKEAESADVTLLPGCGGSVALKS